MSLKPGANGSWRIEIEGRMPQSCTNWPQSCTNWQEQLHPLRVYALLRTGRTVLAGDSRLAVLFDARPEQPRRGRKGDRRSTAVASADSWTIKQD